MATNSPTGTSGEIPQPVRSLCIEINLLQKNQVSFCTSQEVDDAAQLQPTINIPVDHLDWASGRGPPACGREVADFDFLVGTHILAQSKNQSYMLAAHKLAVSRTVTICFQVHAEVSAETAEFLMDPLAIAKVQQE